METFFVFMLITSIRMGIPIAFAALGGVISEKSGVLNFGLEGMMIFGALTAVLVTDLTGNPWLGVLAAAFAGISISAVHSFVSITCGGNQSVSSMSMIMLATGGSTVVLQAIYGTAGKSAQVESLMTTEIFRSLPLVGEFLATFSPIVYIALFILIFVTYMLYKTPLGLRILAVGDDPKAAETAGIHVNKIRFFSVLLSGALGGLGGAQLSIGSFNLFQDGMIAGRGYLAMGAVIMGRWHPVGAFIAALAFGFFEALQVLVQTLPNFPLPTQIIQSMPFVASLVIMAIFSGKKASHPKALGESYSRIANTR